MVATTVKTTTFPCTVVGLRWSLAFTNGNTAANPNASWAVVVVKDGNAANTPSLSNGADFYTPEQNVLAYGIVPVADTDGTTGPRNRLIEGSTKTMRKLKAGDLLQFITLGDNTGVEVKGIVQFFCKS